MLPSRCTWPKIILYPCSKEILLAAQFPGIKIWVSEVPEISGQSQKQARGLFSRVKLILAHINMPNSIPLTSLSSWNKQTKKLVLRVNCLCKVKIDSILHQNFHNTFRTQLEIGTIAYFLTGELDFVNRNPLKFLVEKELFSAFVMILFTYQSWAVYQEFVRS